MWLQGLKIKLASASATTRRAPGSPQLAQRLQSEPGDSGHGWQEQPSGPISPHWAKAWLLHECGVEALSPGPGMQHGPRPVGGMGMRLHMLPASCSLVSSLGSHFLGRVSPIFSPFFPVFCAVSPS